MPFAESTPSGRLRLAYVSPLPPDRSGIADYSADLLPALAAAAEVSVYPEGEAPPAVNLGDIAGLRPLAALPEDVAAGRVDRVIYQLGNSAASHSRTFALLHRLPGVVVLHEYLLHHLVRELTVAQGDRARYFEELRYCAGSTGERAARSLVEHGQEPRPWSFPLFERVVDASEAVLVHSEFARRRILQSRPLARVGVVPMPCALPVGGSDRLAARRRLGLPPEVPLVASFGFVTPQKHLEPAIAAFVRFRREVPEARYWIVGEVSPYYDLAGVIARIAGPGESGITVTGRVELDTLHDAMAACDVALNLRHPTGGESSATLVRLLALGRAVVVTDAGSFAELPAGSVVFVAVDEQEEEHLLAILRRLFADPSLRHALERNAVRLAEREHRPAAAAQRYLEALGRFPPRAPSPVVPPLAPTAPGAMEVRLLGELAAELADLGLGEDDEPLLVELARAFVGLDLDRAAKRRDVSPAAERGEVVR